MESLLGNRASVQVSEPWEFGTECGVGTFEGLVVDEDEGRLLITLDKPVIYKGTNYRMLMGRPRHAAHLGEVAFHKHEIPMNFILYTDCPNLRQDEVGQGIAVIGSARLFDSGQ
jgi:hypothetical protein